MAELGNAFEALGNKMTEQEIKAMIDASDKDADGTVNFEEFCNKMTEQEIK